MVLLNLKPFTSQYLPKSVDFIVISKNYSITTSQNMLDAFVKLNSLFLSENSPYFFPLCVYRCYFICDKSDAITSFITNPIHLLRTSQTLPYLLYSPACHSLSPECPWLYRYFLAYLTIYLLFKNLFKYFIYF